MKPSSSQDTPFLDGEPTDRSDLDELFSITYEELRRLAATVSQDDPSETLNPTALVNQAYIKLAGSLRTTPASELHFKRIAARAMRQVLVEAARRRKARKRGGPDALVTLEEGLTRAQAGADEVLGVDAALNDLARLNPRHARMIEYRFFGGYDIAETARLLAVSEATVTRDWRAARAWLALQLQPGV
jgi:RNA polymerase sigma factor (TIGR02999 family)